MKCLCIRRASGSKRRSGAAIVELAVVLPLLLLLLMGTIEACAAIHLQQSLDITAYEAARTSLLPKATIYTVNEAADKFLTSRKTNGAKVVVAPSNFESLPIGTIITITVSAPSQGNLPVSPFFFQDRTITSSCSMMKEYQ
jgi:Flp pilus assembly protein TadG